MLTSIQFVCPQAKTNSLVAKLLATNIKFSFLGGQSFRVENPSDKFVEWVESVDDKPRRQYDSSSRKSAITKAEFYAAHFKPDWVKV